MTGPIQSPPSAPAQPEPGASGGRRVPVLLRKLSTIAPVAAAYGVFQAVLSSLPPSLSYANLHYLFAIAAGLMVGLACGCALLWTRRLRPEHVPVVTAAPRSHPVPSPSPSLPGMFEGCYRALLGSVVTFDDERLGKLNGWPHFFHEAQARERPTAYGTAYGLKLATMLGDQDGRLDHSELADTLWKLRLPNGGWASRTQGSIGRPEVTAVVLGSLTTAGCDPDRLVAAGEALDSMLRPGQDPAVATSTFVAATVLRELARIRPASTRLEQLRSALLAGAIHDPGHDNLLCWSGRLDDTRAPSEAHTAMAVVALARARRVRGDDNRSRSAFEQASEWLACNRVLENRIDNIRRPVTPDHRESLQPCLFTAAWVVRALTAVGAPVSENATETLDEAIAIILKTQRDGIWAWDDGNQPLWMSYQGVSALQVYALSRWVV